MFNLVMSQCHVVCEFNSRDTFYYFFAWDSHNLKYLLLCTIAFISIVFSVLLYQLKPSYITSVFSSKDCDLS